MRLVRSLNVVAPEYAGSQRASTRIHLYLERISDPVQHSFSWRYILPVSLTVGQEILYA